MGGRANIELTDFNVLMCGEKSEDIESGMLIPHTRNLSGSGIVEIDISLIDDFPHHPFEVIDDAKMDELVEDIEKYGVIHPVILRERGNERYEMISGHRRKYASKKAGKKAIPARILNLSDEDAVILMANANFLQRTEIKPSEKAKAYRMKYEAIKRQGRSGGSSLDEIGEAANESGKTVQRFIRLSFLSDELLSLIDKNRLGIFQGVELSYLDEQNQGLVYEMFLASNVTVSRNQAVLIKKAFQENELSRKKLRKIVCQKSTKREVFLNAETLNKFFGEDISSEEAERIIILLLAKWKKGEL